MDGTFLADRSVIEVTTGLQRTNVSSNTNLDHKRKSDTSVYTLELEERSKRLHPHRPSKKDHGTTIGLQTTGSLDKLEGDNFTHFKELWKLVHKGLKLKSLVEMLEGFENEDLIPQGFKPDIRPAEMITEADYLPAFTSLSRACSIQFMKLTRDMLSLQLRKIEQQITTADNTLRSHIKDWGTQAAVELRLEELRLKEETRLLTRNKSRLEKARLLATKPQQDLAARGRDNVRNQRPPRQNRYIDDQRRDNRQDQVRPRPTQAPHQEPADARWEYRPEPQHHWGYRTQEPVRSAQTQQPPTWEPLPQRRPAARGRRRRPPPPQRLPPHQGRDYRPYQY